MVKPPNKTPKHPRLPLNLQPFREARGLTQEGLAILMEVSDATINRVEKGKQNWNQEFLQEAADHLGVHWTELLPPVPGTILEAYANVPVEDRARALKAVLVFVPEDRRRKA